MLLKTVAGLKRYRVNSGFANLFDDDDRLVLDNSWSARYDVTRRRQATAAADVMSVVDADLYLIVEAPNSGADQSSERALERFAARFGLRQRSPRVGALL